MHLATSALFIGPWKDNEIPRSLKYFAFYI